jgi:hypothetical protein
MMVQDTSEKMLAEAYIWSNENDPELYGEWDFEVNLIFFHANYTSHRAYKLIM